MEYLLHILILVGIYVMLSVSLDLIAGYTGLLSIAHAAFYGVGAYVAALMALKLHSPFLANIVCAVILSGLLGALVGIPSLRIRDDYFVIATFAFQVITFSVLNNWVSFTGGPMGLAGIPQPTIFGLRVTSHVGFLVLVGSLLGFFVHPYFIGISAFVGAGLMFAGITDSCAMGMMLAKMPWNQVRPCEGGSCGSAT